jgi:transcriptional regulator of acetoin/glycerol metabolism
MSENQRAGRSVLAADDLSLRLREVDGHSIRRMLEGTRGDWAAAARRLGVDRGTLNRKLKQWNEPGLSEGPASAQL